MTRPLYFDCSPRMAESLTAQLRALCPALEIHLGNVPRAELPTQLAGRRILVLGNTWLGAAELAPASPFDEHLMALSEHLI